MSENSINIPFSLKNSVSMNDLKSSTNVYFVPSSTISKIEGHLTKNDQFDELYEYSIKPVERTDIAGNGMKYNITSHEVKVSWDALINYLVDCHELPEETSSSTPYYIRWFGDSGINGYNLLDDVESSGNIYNYADTICSVWDSSKGNSPDGDVEYTTRRTYTYKTYGTADPNKNKVNYYTDTMSGTVSYVGIKSFTLCIQCDSMSEIPSQITCRINDHSINCENWTGTNGTYCCTIIDNNINSSHYAFSSRNLYIDTNDDGDRPVEIIDENFYTIYDENNKKYVTMSKDEWQNIDLNLILSKQYNYEILHGQYFNQYFKYCDFGDFSSVALNYDNFTVHDTSIHANACSSSSNYHSFFKHCTLSTFSKSKLFTNAMSNEISDVDNIIIPYQLENDSSIWKSTSKSYEYKSGVHIFGTMRRIKNLIDLTILDDNISKILNAKFDIKDVKFTVNNDYNKNYSKGYKIAGSRSDSSDSNETMYPSVTSIGLLSVIETACDAIKSGEIDDVNTIEVNDVSVRTTICGDSSAYNSNIVTGTPRYIKTEATFYTTAKPKISYVKGSLKIDGFSSDDLNGYMNLCLNSESHVISLEIKNDTGMPIMVRPCIFNINNEGVFVNDSSEADSSYNYNTSSSSDAGFSTVQFNPKIYANSVDGFKETYVVRIASYDLMNRMLINYNHDSDGLEDWKSNIFAKAKINKDFKSIIDYNSDPLTIDNMEGFYEIGTNDTENINIQITNNESYKSAIFGIGVESYIYISDQYDYTDDMKIIKMFNNLSDFPAFIQTGSITNEPIKYMFNTEGEEGLANSIINISDEIKNWGADMDDDQLEVAARIIVDTKTCNIKWMPWQIVDDALYIQKEEANNLCLNESDIVLDYTKHDNDRGKYETAYKYISMMEDNTRMYESDWSNLADN